MNRIPESSQTNLFILGSCQMTMCKDNIDMGTLNIPHIVLFGVVKQMQIRNIGVPNDFMVCTPGKTRSADDNEMDDASYFVWRLQVLRYLKGDDNLATSSLSEIFPSGTDFGLPVHAQLLKVFLPTASEIEEMIRSTAMPLSYKWTSVNWKAASKSSSFMQINGPQAEYADSFFQFRIPEATAPDQMRTEYGMKSTRNTEVTKVTHVHEPRRISEEDKEVFGSSFDLLVVGIQSKRHYANNSKATILSEYCKFRETAIYRNCVFLNIIGNDNPTLPADQDVRQNIGVVTRVHFGEVFKSYFSKSKQYSQDAWDFQKELHKKLLFPK